MTFTYIRRMLKEEEKDRVETRRILARKVYEDLLLKKKSEYRTMIRECTSFIYDKVLYSLQMMRVGEEKVVILRTAAADKIVNFPDFIPVLEDITENPKYFTKNLAFIDKL